MTDSLLPSDDDITGLPSQVFEHLSCFLPGLLALGAHTLPLDDLQSVGIDFGSMGDHALYNGTSNIFRALKLYDLKQLHLWAAEGLAHTCWLTYADQPSGLGPDEVFMQSTTSERKWNPQIGQWENVGASEKWIDAMHRWKRSGGRGTPPGVSTTTKPVVWTQEDQKGNSNRRDYHVRKAGYLLRPGVRGILIMGSTTMLTCYC